MIEIIDAQTCIGCDRCVEVCPTDVFDVDASGLPVIARLDDCQTCFLCEAHCPVDALFVHPTTTPAPRAELRSELMGSYREALGWGKGRTPGASTAVDLVFGH